MVKKTNKLFNINFKDRTVDICVKKNKLSRNYKLTFDKKNLCGLVSIPNYISFKSGLEFADENIEWLYNEMNKYYPLIRIKHNSLILLKGKKTKVLFKNGNSHSINLSKDILLVISHLNNHKTILKRWFDEEILKNSRKIIFSLSKKMNIDIKHIKISNSFNYWGSCSSKGIIHLNWRLIFSPPEVLEYIIVHEVCHLVEFNHNNNFWKLVQKMCPDYKKRIRWLKKYDGYLYRVRM